MEIARHDEFRPGKEMKTRIIQVLLKSKNVTSNYLCNITEVYSRNFSIIK